MFQTAVWNTGLFRAADGGSRHRWSALAIALMVSRLKGWLQSLILAAFFLPYILPVTVVYLIWKWMIDLQFGIAQYLIEPIVGEPVNVWRRPPWFMPMVALVTIWWTNGFIDPALPRRPAEHLRRRSTRRPQLDGADALAAVHARSPGR